MTVTNVNLPPIEVFIHDSYLYNGEDKKSSTKGFLVSIRALKNRMLQFSVLLETGALFTGLPATAIMFKSNIAPESQHLCQMWDNISNKIEVLTLDLLRSMNCTVKLKDTRIVGGQYLFSIDYLDEDTLAGHPEHWKQLHAIKLDSGHFVLYPQYRIRFFDDALCTKPLQKYKANTTTYFSD